MSKTRTFWDISLVVGIPFSRWGARPFVTSPFPYPIAYIEELKYQANDKSGITEYSEHPIHCALRWCEQLKHDSTLTKALLARNEDVSRARVTQVMSLLELPEEIRHFLKQLTSPREIRFFSERRLRRILSIRTPSLQQQMWNEIVEQLKSAVSSRANEGQFAP